MSSAISRTYNEERVSHILRQQRGRKYAYYTRERQLANKKVCALLVFANFPQRDRTRPKPASWDMCSVSQLLTRTSRLDGCTYDAYHRPRPDWHARHSPLHLHVHYHLPVADRVRQGQSPYALNLFGGALLRVLDWNPRRRLADDVCPSALPGPCVLTMVGGTL